MASSTFGSHAPEPATRTLPQLVSEAMSLTATEAAHAELDGHVGERVTYHPMLSRAPKSGVLLELGSRSAMVRWDDGSISTAPFMSRLELEK